MAKSRAETFAEKTKSPGQQERVRALTGRSVANGVRTKAKILSVAEDLFAEDGFDGTSIRQIAQNADVPLALVSYHFKSKLDLYREVFRSRLGEVTKLRISLLHNVDSTAGGEDVVRQITRILVEPIVGLETKPGGRSIARLIARESNDPRENQRGIIEESFDPIASIAISKLGRAFPQADKRTVYWAYLFAMGALAINHAATGRIERLSGNLCRSDDAQGILRNLVEFISGGILSAFAAAAIQSPQVKQPVHRRARITKRARAGR
jgi:AcrR family transcriptional regulator